MNWVGNIQSLDGRKERSTAVCGTHLAALRYNLFTLTGQALKQVKTAHMTGH